MGRFAARCRRELVGDLQQGYRVSARRACRVLRAPRSTHCYRSRKDPQAFLRKRVRQIAETRTRYGYRRTYLFLRREGLAINHKRVYRLYCEEGLQVRQKPPKRRVAARVRGDRVDAGAPNDCWSMDFMHDQLFDGHRLRVLTVVDNYTKLCPAIGVRHCYRGSEVVKALDRADNAFIEAFNSWFRKECLNQHWFLDLEDARSKIEQWRYDYNMFRPHGAIGDLTPLEFLLSCSEAAG